MNETQTDDPMAGIPHLDVEKHLSAMSMAAKSVLNIALGGSAKDLTLGSAERIIDAPGASAAKFERLFETYRPAIGDVSHQLYKYGSVTAARVLEILAFHRESAGNLN